jgi:hypothetical protein
LTKTFWRSRWYINGLDKAAEVLEAARKSAKLLKREKMEKLDGSLRNELRGCPIEKGFDHI